MDRRIGSGGGCRRAGWRMVVEIEPCEGAGAVGQMQVADGAGVNRADGRCRDRESRTHCGSDRVHKVSPSVSRLLSGSGNVRMAHRYMAA